jgi:hypothetical protein
MATEVTGGGGKWHRHPIVAVAVGTVVGLMVFTGLVIPALVMLGWSRFFRSPTGS